MELILNISTSHVPITWQDPEQYWTLSRFTKGCYPFLRIPRLEVSLFCILKQIVAVISPPHPAKKSQVAARLGASVVLTDQSKILPTLFRNARANAQDLECRRRPTSLDCFNYMDHPEDVSKSPSQAKDGVRTTTFTSTVSTARAPSPTSTPGRHDNDDGTCTKSAIRHPCGGGYRCGNGASISKSLKRVDGAPPPHCDVGNSTASGVRCCFCGATNIAMGRWRVAELLFSKSEEDLRRWRGVTFGREDKIQHYSRGEDLFDLVVAADVVYLNDLWDSMACTLKVRIYTTYFVFSNPKGLQKRHVQKHGNRRGVFRWFDPQANPPPPPPMQAMLKPSGEALMTFEQRRSNVDGFFGPPRFGGEHANSWEHGEEIDFGQGVFTATGLGDAAKASRVRLFRMRRRDGVC